MIHRARLALLTLSVALTGCSFNPEAPAVLLADPSPPASPTAALTATPRPSSTPPHTATATTPATDPPSPTPGCDEPRGTVVVTELVDPELPRSLPYRVYLPPCAQRWRGRLPTLYLLHGLAYTDSQWHELGIDGRADLLIRLGVAGPFLIVMPWERLGLDYEPTIVEYLLPHVEAEYGASPDPRLRAIGGISRGAGWALRIGLAHSDRFAAVGLHSPAVLVPDLFNLPRWLEAGPAPALWIDIGDRDPLRFSAMDLTAALDELGVAYQFQMFAGEHAPAYWSLHVEEYLRWYLSHWN